VAGTYRAVMLTRKGGPEVLKVVELPVEAPGPGQLRVRVRCCRRRLDRLDDVDRKLSVRAEDTVRARL